jgi:glutathione S-transferase
MTKLGASAGTTRLRHDDAPPPSSRERRDYVRWLYFAITKLQPCVLEALLVKDDARAFAKARENFLSHAREIEAALEGRAHLLGEKLTAADEKMAEVLAWAESLGLLGPGEKLRAYARRCGS